MKAQTYLDVTRGLDVIHSQLGGVLFVDRKKAAIASDEGALSLLAAIEQITEAMRQVILHDSGLPMETDFRALTS